MTHDTRVRRRWWLPGALVLAVALGLVVVEPGSDGARAGDQRSMVVVGDSISASYDDEPGSPLQAWWSLVARELGYTPTVLAEAGSGYQRPGAGCSGTAFGDRPGVFDQPPPDLVLVEGGRNDWARCDGTDLVEVDPEAVLAAADEFLGRLTRAYPDARVVVLAPPWGPLHQQYVDGVTDAIETAAERHDCDFVRMDGVLPAARTTDGAHPDIAGSAAIADTVVQALR
ncbi:SGNH/GDSL hydrolase family protein [Aeromicrobium sp. Sec7.5]|uniref:SGNH/GDSL hydrolase family protein n=1 Tax=Aeromicrobium sp. Sec7.5 TaxID=3121276 RepID=UPI002FE452CC